MNKAVFLDRDGTLNVDKGYIYKPNDFEFTEHASDAIRKLCEAEYKVIVISNQSGIGRGYYTESELHLLHKHIDNELEKSGAHIDAYYYCPHHPDAGCNCRKPKTGLIEQAAVKYDINIASSWMVGDKSCDAECAANAGLRFAWISKEGGEGKRFANLLDFARYLFLEA